MFPLSSLRYNKENKKRINMPKSKLEKKIEKQKKKLQKSVNKLSKKKESCPLTGEPHKFEVVKDTNYYLHGHHGVETRCIFCNKKK